MVRGCQPYSLDSTVREIEPVNPVDKVLTRLGRATYRVVTEVNPQVASLNVNYGGRACFRWAKTEPLSGKTATYTQGHHRGNRGDTIEKDSRETRETLPYQLSLFGDDLKPMHIRQKPKVQRDREGVGAVHSSDNRWDNITHRSEGAALQPTPAKQRGGSDSPKVRSTNGRNKIQELQRRLYLKSKSEQTHRYYSLYDKVFRDDVLREAWKRVRANKGACGVDGQTIEYIERGLGIEQFLRNIKETLRQKKYKPDNIRRVYIPKPDGDRRPLGIPTIRDRIVQMAVKIVIEPIFEADFQEVSYGFRPKRSAHQALRKVWSYLMRGYTEVIDVDIEKFFDTIPHAKLMELVAKRIADKNVLKLIRGWLRAGIMEEGRVRRNTTGTPQGGVLSPLLANIYLNYLDIWWERSKLRQKNKAYLVRYADDMVIVVRKGADKAMEILKEIVEELGLKLNLEKTKIIEIGNGRLDFLGFTFKRVWNSRKKRWFILMFPSERAMRLVRQRVKDITNPKRTLKVEMIVRELNPVLRGWVNYFRIGHSAARFKKLRYYAGWKVRKYMSRRRNKHWTGWKRWSDRLLCKRMGLYDDYRVCWRSA